ncbi:hypothetical protein GQ457_01G015360 [Hibiscus cannabinus]
MEKIRRLCGFPNGLDVSSIGRGGGLSIGWKEDCNVTLRSYSDRHIDIFIEDDTEGKRWRCTGFYGAPEVQNRRNSWNLLRRMDDCPNVPWLVIGDFNEISAASEKQGGLVRSERQMTEFRSMLTDCSLSDLGFSGQWFTWERGRRQINNIRERLDRGVANGAWTELFPTARIEHMQHSFSDHCPLLLNTCIGDGRPRKWHFRFEATWLAEESCQDVVKRIWEQEGGSVPDKLQKVCTGLDRWFANLKKEKQVTIRSLKSRLADLNEQAVNDEVLGEITDIKLALNLESDKEELYWEQRARANWLKNGDRNTAFFHKFASQRKRKNRISDLVDSSGQTVSDEAGLHTIAKEFFQDIFSSQRVSNMENLLDGVSPCITSNMNKALLRDFTREEVFHALQSMSPLKASGKDGLGAIFYQRFWHIIGIDVANFCIDILRGSFPMANINETHIVLIPKVMNPQSMSQYRPISLCNVIYKIVSKMIVNRFQGVLHLCIDEAQSAFIPEEDTDSILSIPLASNRNEDKLIWYGEPTGKYSVRSGYKGLFDQLSLDPINRWMQWLFEHNRCFSKEFFAVSLWALWSARNKFIFEGVSQSTSDLLTFIRAYCFEYQVMSTILDHPNPQKEIRWSPPNPPLVKVNVDAKFVQELKKAWSGIVIRDGNGDILGACVRIQNYSSSPFSAEAWAVVHGLQFASSLGCQSIILESDCRMVIQKLQSEDDDYSELRPFIWDAKILSRHFLLCGFNFVPRSGNKAAHAMAAEGSPYSADEFWIENAPPHVLTVIDEDRQ